MGRGGVQGARGRVVVRGGGRGVIRPACYFLPARPSALRAYAHGLTHLVRDVELGNVGVLDMQLLLQLADLALCVCRVKQGSIEDLRPQAQAGRDHHVQYGTMPTSSMYDTLPWYHALLNNTAQSASLTAAVRRQQPPSVKMLPLLFGGCSLTWAVAAVA